MEQDEDHRPNSANAYPSTTSTDPAAVSASWNPALRHNREPSVDSDAEFFDRYPGGTPKKSQIPEAETLEEPDSPTRRQSISVEHIVDIRHEDASPGDLERVPSNHVEVEGPGGYDHYSEEEEDDDEKDEILHPGDSAVEQEQALEDRMPDLPFERENTQDVEEDVEQVDYAAAGSRQHAQSVSEHYDHQGEVTEMEEAQEASEMAPLIDDEEELPTPGVVTREPTMPIPSRESTLDFDGTPAPRQPQAKSEPAPPSLDRAFTTNFSDSPIEAPSRSHRPQQSISAGWPSVGDDATFGELLDTDTTQPSSQPDLEDSADLSNQLQPASEEEKVALERVADEESQQMASPDAVLLPEEEGEVKEEDLAAAWGAAIDDDELLEDTLDPSTFFGQDDDGFLENEASSAPAPVQSQPQQQQRTAPAPVHQYQSRNPPQQQTPQQRPHYSGAPNSYFSQPIGRSAGTPATGLSDIYNTSGATQQQQQHQPQPQQRPQIQQAQSFADKAKGGYQSPYDLPMEVVKPRRRPQNLQHQPSTQANAAPPPRSSSMTSSTANTPVIGSMPFSSRPPTSGAPAGAPPARPRTGGSTSSLSPPPSSHSGGSAGTVSAAGTVKSTPKSGSGFFEELPMTSKPRSRPTGAFTPQPQGVPMAVPPTPPTSTQPPQNVPRPAPMPAHVLPPTMQRPAITPMESAGDLGLRRPDRMPLIPDQPVQQQQHPPPQASPQGPPPSTRYSPRSMQQQAPAVAPAAAVQNRYSPAPTSTASAPAVAPRYSPAPASGPAPPAKPRQASVPGPTSSVIQQFHPFAPRTSSPLAAMQTDKPHPPLPPEASRGPPASPPKANGIQQPPSTISPPGSGAGSRYAPSEASRVSDPPMTFAPPQRPRTQSPDATMKGPKYAMQQPLPRPSSSAGMPIHAPPQQIGQRRPALPHRRQFSRELTFAVPTDERGQDPLERWRGHAIFKWSASGTVISSFPKQTPFYAAGQGIPSVKCTPGVITMQDVSLFMPMEDRNSKFPGPLTARSKRQKKDVVSWLGAKIEDLERQAESAMLDFSMEPSLRKRAEEKLILWKMVRIFVEHDGVLEGNPKIEEEVRRVLLPNLAQMAQVVDLQSPTSAAVMPDPVDKRVLFQIRQALLEGQRERAVWLAEEKKLWGHAMLIASTMGPEVWKQIVQAFVRNQVKNVGSDARSTAALYQVFAGNAEECVDELVPPSARAGFQMISQADGRAKGDPLEGLDQWRETLGLITSNRTASDAQSLLALGKLLANYGRVEAAHTCYLFARALAKYSGPDDADAQFVLLGANHQSQDEVFGNDLDSILLTEVFEYATSLSAPSTSVPYIPHLQAFKLIHAQELAAFGLKDNALMYCDAITSAYTSTTRPSPYYHPNFTQAVADFSAFLSQTPHDAKSGFFSKPSMNKVSSGAASWFSKFVAGDEDQQSTNSGPSGAGSEDMAGPFGRVNGESPSISRTTSGTDLYDPMMGGMPIPGMAPATTQSFAPASAPSRYAPGGQMGGSKHSPAQLYSGLGMPAAEPQRPGSSRYAPAPSSNLGVPSRDLSRKDSNQSLPSYAPSSRRGSAQDTSSQGSYEPRPILTDEGSAYSYSPAFNSPLVQPQHAPAVQEPEVDLAAPNGLPELLHAEDVRGFDAETRVVYEPPSSGYEPPSYSYQPYEPEPDSPEDSKAKKRSYGGEDDKLAKSATATKKTQADREADDAFKKAAEADAARDKAGAGSQKKGWISGWFGKREATASPGPIRAKLGEDNSFYYDENLKKWVNKKAGAETATPAAATPPPPKGAASRVASASATMGPPPGPPSRSISGTALSAPSTRPPTSGSGPALSGPPSGPPSRTGTPASSEPGNLAPPGVNGDSSAAPPLRPGSSLSTASSIDDLLAGLPPGSRKGGTVKGKKKGRYVDVMAQ